MDKKKKPKLIPPDPNQCQAERQVGAFSMGGHIGERTRCTNRPSVIITEKRKDKDGLIGSMSLCNSCLDKAKNQLGDSFTIKEITILQFGAVGDLVVELRKSNGKPLDDLIIEQNMNAIRMLSGVASVKRISNTAGLHLPKCDIKKTKCVNLNINCQHCWRYPYPSNEIKYDFYIT